MLFFVFDSASLGARFFSLGWLRFTGIISYEWFLFHGPVVRWFIDHYPGHTNGNVLAYAWRTLVPLALTFGFSALVYRYFSLPILHRVRDNLKKP
jgi:peptidoglycan/LPS O-acetylase OafA/YrhL